MTMLKKDISNFAIIVVQAEEVELYHIIDIDAFWSDFKTVREWLENERGDDCDYTIFRGVAADPDQTCIFPEPTTLYTIVDI